ncbi:MAG: hypothetical protein AVDCRST_MAG06-1813, partial [uncultured Nocardioides sp.]
AAREPVPQHLSPVRDRARDRDPGLQPRRRRRHRAPRDVGGRGRRLLPQPGVPHRGDREPGRSGL